MRAAGMASLSLDELVATRIHRATPEFIAEMEAVNRVAGYTSGEDYEAYRDSVAEAAKGDLAQAVRDFAGLVE